MLRLIAIKNYRPQKSDNIDKKRYSNIYKVLDNNSVFFFCKGYELHKDDTVSKPQDDIQDEDFYSEGDPCIDFCAVVGKNGCGKSSLFELYLRIMNNLAYACHRAINDGKAYNTQFVCDIYSSIYFYDTSENKSLAVKQIGSCLTYTVNGDEQFHYDYNLQIKSNGVKQDSAPSISKARECLEELCYTMVINYSSYSYNREDYFAEWDTINNNLADIEGSEGERTGYRCWIDSLFHKNDGYQLPIVLNPFRENGLVDYNNERDLTQERLYKLTLSQSTSIKTILNNSEIDRFVLDVDNELNPAGNKNYASYKVLSQLQILRLINDIKSDHSFKIADEIGEKVIHAWSACLGVNLKSYIEEERFDDGVKRNTNVLQALNYIVYKTLKIPRVYPNYQIYNTKEEIESNAEGLIKELFLDGSHITLKIRRCLAYLIFRPYKITDVSSERLKASIQRCHGRRKSVMTKARRQHKIERYDLDFEYDWQEDDFFPAPAFKVSMYLKKADEKGSGKISLSTMSSGERQTLSSISTLAYHLANIESVWSRQKSSANDITYRNVCVFFDEMDLYLHPEYQTRMVQLIIDVIKGLKLKSVKSIQIICATHSPFILSDIPQRNVLYLTNGNDVSNTIDNNPFCANINDILFQSFFLEDGFTGLFAREKINDLIRRIDNIEDFSKTEESKIIGLIKNIGEPIVKEQLMLMYMEKRFGDSNTSKKRWLQKIMDNLGDETN